MKKILSILFAVTLAGSLAACSGENALPDTGENTTPQTSATLPVASEPADESTEATATEPSSAPETAEPEAGGTLVAYFSWSGNTQQLAGIIQQETGGTLFEITPAQPYTEDYDALLDQAQQEQQDNARPALATQVENWEAYDVVFVGYPDWWSDAPMLIYSFLESYDWTGKTLIPFCTSGGSGFGRSLSGIESSAPGATILEGLHVLGSNVDGAAGEVAAWIDGLNLS